DVLHGHIIDSLILAKVLDTILMMGGTFDLTDVKIGATREEPSHARIVVRAASGRLLAEILEAIQPHGASVERESDCPLEPAPADGLFPENFYATTHLPTQVRLQGREALAWLIESGFIHVLFCGNALAAHDMEAHLFGTSLGFRLSAGRAVPHGHEHHLRTINRIRAIGSIEKAVRTGVITEGIMAAC